MKKHFFFLVSAFVLLSCAQAQFPTLARRSFLGIQMEKITDDTKRIMELPSENGVLITKVIAGSSAENAGLLASDVLLKINGKEVNSPDEAVKTVAEHKGGEEFTYEIIRNKKTVNGKSVFKEYPKENYKDIEMEYTATQTINGIQRLIVSKPKKNSKKMPVIIYIGGIGCYSLDNPLDTTKNEVQFLNSLTRAGFVCVRAEKPGIGDNTACKACAEISFNEELDGYVNAVKTIKTYNYVDSSRIYIFGHSMGGVMAPLIAQQTPVKGIIAYGTIGSNFMEYLLKTRRTIGEAYSWSEDETDGFIKDYCECAGYYFTDKMSSDEAAKKNPDCKQYLNVFDYRSRAYNNELYALNIPAAWKPFKGKALLLWGGSDFIASKEDHEIITSTVNRFHPGNAEFKVVENSAHAFGTAFSFQEALKNPGIYNKLVTEKVLNWLKIVS
ncbi:MAG: alpha/beta fold hydrolase [Bacteroidia bacterium]|nr:alpha/beta fold hydrolase [Bacteroidia bacterium]